MNANNQVRAEITNFGEIKRLQSPPGWVAIQDAPQAMSSRVCKMFHPPDAADITINVYYRGVPVNPQSITILQAVLKSKPATKGPERLSVDDIKALSHVFGRNTVGDNQFTNDAEKGTYDYPVFHLVTAETILLKGRTVLKVTGTFQDEHATPTTEYQGYLFEARNDSQRIEEVFYQAPNKEKFNRCVEAFEESLQSLEWR